jgi:hypothetical protein
VGPDDGPRRREARMRQLKRRKRLAGGCGSGARRYRHGGADPGRGPVSSSSRPAALEDAARADGPLAQERARHRPGTTGSRTGVATR